MASRTLEHHASPARATPSYITLSFLVLQKNEVVESSASQSIWITLFEAAKYTYSLVLLVFSIIVIMAAICEEQTNGFEVRVLSQCR